YHDAWSSKRHRAAPSQERPGWETSRMIRLKRSRPYRQVVVGGRGAGVAGTGGGGVVRDSAGAGRGGTGVAAPSAGAVVVAPCVEVPPHCFDGAVNAWPDTMDFDGAASI